MHNVLLWAQSSKIWKYANRMFNEKNIHRKKELNNVSVIEADLYRMTKK